MIVGIDCRSLLAAKTGIGVYTDRLLRGLAECDVVIPISGFSGKCLKDFWTEQGLKGGSVVDNLLPAEFGGSSRVSCPEKPKSEQLEILCVST